MRQHHDAFSRALSWWCREGAGKVEDLLNRIVFELAQVIGEDVRGIAVLFKRKGAPFFVARSMSGTPVPQEVLCSLFLEHLREGGVCRVKDHALDTVRLLEGRFRTSVLVSFQMPTTLVGESESALWLGLRGGATAESRASGEVLAKELTEWMSRYSGVVSALTLIHERQTKDQQRIAELTALLHDARAPLGVLKYLSCDGGGDDASEAMGRELEYLDTLLAQGAPRSLSGRLPTCDVRAVLTRVRQRFALEVGEERIRLEGGYEEINASVSDLDLERVITNLVSNSFRHSPGCHVSLRLESRKNHTAVFVQDDGVGIPREILQAINRGNDLPDQSTAGWGVGLRSCHAKLRAINGGLSISTDQGLGTTVEVLLPLAPPTPSRAVAYVADSAPIPDRLTPRDVVIIDDDREHGESLNRLLLRFGVEAEHYSSIDSFMGSRPGHEGTIVLCDANMPDGGAERLLTLLTDRPLSPRVAVMSGEVNDEYLYRVSALGAQAFFGKPVDISEVCTWIREVRGMKVSPLRGRDGKEVR